MASPTLDDVVRDLEQLEGRELDPSLTVKDLAIDSLTLAEWMFSLQERLNVYVEDERLESFLDLSVSEIYEQLAREAGLQLT
jgi:acyl carrier protein